MPSVKAFGRQMSGTIGKVMLPGRGKSVKNMLFISVFHIESKSSGEDDER